MCSAGDAGRDADQHGLAHLALAGEALQPLDVVERVQHDMTNAGVQRLAQLRERLRVAMQVDARWIEAAAQRKRQLSAGGDVAGDPLGGEQLIRGGARERLGGEQHVEVIVAGTHRVYVGASTSAQVVLRIDVRGSAELACELDCVAAADLKVAACVDAATKRKDVREPLMPLGLGRSHAGVIMPARPLSPGAAADTAPRGLAASRSAKATQQSADHRAGARDDLTSGAGRAAHDTARELPCLRHHLPRGGAHLADDDAQLAGRALDGAAELLTGLRDDRAGTARDLRDRPTEAWRGARSRRGRHAGVRSTAVSRATAAGTELDWRGRRAIAGARRRARSAGTRRVTGIAA